jgi:hypothetical protein
MESECLVGKWEVDVEVGMRGEFVQALWGGIWIMGTAGRTGQAITVIVFFHFSNQHLYHTCCGSASMASIVQFLP